MNALPDPLTPADCDLRGLEYMPLLGTHLFGSDFNARANDTEFRVALTLWWAAWTQKPAASLPDDDQALCRFADLGRDMRTWRKVKKVALHGFVKCSDGRLYHKTLGEQASIAWEKRVNDRKRKAEWRARRESERAGQSELQLEENQELSEECHADATRTERSRHAENALNRRDGTGRDVREEPKPALSESIPKPEPRTHAHEDDPPPGIANAADALNYVCRAAAWHPSSDTQRQASISIINGWLALGCSLEMILSAIARARKRDPSPTRTLKRFDSTVRGMRRDQLGGELPVTADDMRAMATGAVKRLAAGG